MDKCEDRQVKVSLTLGGASIDIVGQKSHKLTVTKDIQQGKILAVCDCGNIKEYYKASGRGGNTNRCY